MPTTLTYAEADRGDVPVGELRLASDSGFNPMSGGVVERMRAVLRETADRSAPHLLLLSAEGRAFSAGADLKEFQDMDAEGFRAFMSGILAMYAEMCLYPKPIVAVVHADALGGGCALALFSDFVIAAEQARFALPEVHRGLAGGGYLIPRLMGKQRAAEMVMLGRSYTAAEMHGLGLVNEVSPADRLDDTATAFCRRVGRIAPGALAVGKRSLYGGLFDLMKDGMARHVEAQTRAFVEARKKGTI
jgi:enoyl-CoA hydratase/carnithine racemase